MRWLIGCKAKWRSFQRSSFAVTPTSTYLRLVTCAQALALKHLRFSVSIYYTMTQSSENQATPVELRKRANLTQRRASDLIGVRESTISDWERGLSAPSVLLVPIIAKTYGCSEEEVVGAFVRCHQQTLGQQ